jgi:pantoate--beta-alanine ligase
MMQASAKTMKTASSVIELRKLRKSMIGTFGLVPTMGALHAGHISLVRQAKLNCQYVGVSIFVNPTQFGQGEDLAAYPRPLQRDLEMLERAGADLVWTPTPDDMYPVEFQSWVTVEEVTRPLEGKIRLGHFRGVATVVAKLFNAFTPDFAYFGQKDAQQLAVIRRMVQDLNFPIKIIACPTVREPDGLAMSSRNAYLNQEERRAASVLFRALNAAKALYMAGERKGDRLRAEMQQVLQTEQLAAAEYVSVAHPETMSELEEIAGSALLSMAVRIGKTRLIDNFLI